MTMNRLTAEIRYNPANREALRQDLIREQLDKAEAGLEMILDGTHAADVHYLNALNIVTDAHQGMKLAALLAKMHAVRLEMWGALGISNNETTRGRG